MFANTRVSQQGFIQLSSYNNGTQFNVAHVTEAEVPADDDMVYLVWGFSTPPSLRFRRCVLPQGQGPFKRLSKARTS